MTLFQPNAAFINKALIAALSSGISLTALAADFATNQEYARQGY